MTDQSRLAGSHPGSEPTILFVITGLGVGGAEKQVVDLARGLRSRGHTVSVATLLDPGPLAAELTAAGVAIDSLHMQRGRPSPAAIRRLRTIVREREPDVVHSHMVHANLLTRIALGRTQRRVHVDTAHNIVEGGPLRDLLQRLTRHRTDWMTTVSRAAFERYEAAKLLVPHRASVIPNGVDLGTLATTAIPSRVRGEAFRWTCVARLVPEKSLDHLIEATRLLVDRGHAVMVSIAGDGTERSSLEALVRRSGLDERVTLLGTTNDVPGLLRRSHGFVLSSTVEGLPLALLEAAAIGLPVVTTDAGGCGEAVDEGKTGLVVPRGSPAALADAMDRVMSLAEDERARWASAGRELVRSRFDLERVLDSWQLLYASLSAERRP